MKKPENNEVFSSATEEVGSMSSQEPQNHNMAEVAVVSGDEGFENIYYAQNRPVSGSSGSSPPNMNEITVQPILRNLSTIRIEEGDAEEPPMEMVEMVDTECPGPLRYRKVQTGLLIFLAVATAAVMGAFIAVTLRNNKDNGSGSQGRPSGNSVEDDSSQPTADSQERWVAIADFLTDQGLATPTSFLESSAPRTRAVDWLVYEDQTYPPLSDEFLQRYVLILFAFSTGVELWRALNPWTEQVNSHECTFDGIDCDLDGRVTSMALPLWRLSGTIPPELGLVLTDLTSLVLNQNKLEGSIPESLYEMTKLGMKKCGVFGCCLCLNGSDMPVFCRGSRPFRKRTRVDRKPQD